jgi:hypothetical protein
VIELLSVVIGCFIIWFGFILVDIASSSTHTPEQLKLDKHLRDAQVSSDLRIIIDNLEKAIGEMKKHGLEKSTSPDEVNSVLAHAHYVMENEKRPYERLKAIQLLRELISDIDVYRTATFSWPLAIAGILISAGGILYTIVAVVKFLISL